jgi:hypothetical protein
MNPKSRILIAILVGGIAAYLTTVLPVTVVYKDVPLGDICCPLLQFKNFMLNHSAYRPMITINHSTPVVAYPFTAVLFLSPLWLFPLTWIGPIFCGLTSSVFAYALLHDGKPWKLLILASPAYLTSISSIQYAPLLAAAFYLPFLLPLAVIKPQLGIPLLAAGRWSKTTLLAALSIVLVSLAVYPAWPFDWLTNMNFGSYDGKIPVFQGAGFLLLLSAFKWRDERARLLLAMALMPQRLWYDQLVLLLIPRTRIQLYILLIGAWLSVLVSPGGLMHTTVRDQTALVAVVSFVYLPLLCIIFQEELKLFASTLIRRVYEDTRDSRLRAQAREHGDAD